jgi:hypothetical protein
VFLAIFPLPRTPRSHGGSRCSQGPLVGKKMPSTVITEEYAKAHQVYVQKTMVGARYFVPVRHATGRHR